MASSALPMFGLILLLHPCETISRGPSSKNGCFRSSDSASSCVPGRRFCMDPLDKIVSSAPCASLTRSTLEKGRDSNSLLGSEGFRIGFAKHIVGVAKFQAGSGPPHKLPKMTRFDNEFVMKMLHFPEGRIFRFLGAAPLTMNFAPLWCVLHRLQVKMQILVRNWCALRLRRLPIQA